MIVELKKTFRFEAAHHLPNLPDGHKCRRLHGHSFYFDVVVRGPVDEHTGLLMDFADIVDAVEPIRREVDHYHLNEIEGLENPSSEIIARWLWNRIVQVLPMLHAIRVRETCTSECTFRGEH
ncbi:MAG: 6-carboxytetrahydropterin synthase QueD [Myxococcales bacterium]|nr:6-carboxytetrahydropterin synthase QueD [Myxococcales bacterium]